MSVKATLSALVTAAIVCLTMGTVPAQATAVPVNATTASDFSGDGRAEIVTPSSDGTLWMYRGNGTSGFARVASPDRPGLEQLRPDPDGGNWDGVAGTDIIARNAATGALVLYLGERRGRYPADADDRQRLADLQSHLLARRLGRGWPP